MKKQLITFLSFVVFIGVFAQSEQEIFKQTDKLILAKQYYTAYQKLDRFDSLNLKPEIVIKKEEIVLNYFVSSFMHQMFALKDLDEGETVMDYRGKVGTYSMVSFPVSDILDTLIIIYPDNYKLRNALAEYYYEVYLKYGANWLKTEDELLKLVKENYTEAINHNVGDYLSYYVMGYLSVYNEENKESIPYFKKSINLKFNYPSSHYNLAYAYMNVNKLDSAIIEAKISATQYEDSVYKADAYKMIGLLYSDLNDTVNAIKYLEFSNNTDLDNYYTLKSLLNVYAYSNNSKQEAFINKFFLLAPENPTIYNDLYEIYANIENLKYLENFYKSKQKEYSDNYKVLGNLYFYLAQIQSYTDKKEAKKNFIKAKKTFSKVYSKDHRVFEIIEEALKEL